MPVGLAVAGVVGLSIGAVVATWLIRRSKKVSNPLQRLLQRFENQAKEDFITGLANDRGMHEALQQELVLQPSGQHIAWLTYIKLPDLGVVNELFGLAGTTGIGTALAKHLQALCPNATIARMNQGKFAVLQRAGSIADVNELAHELYKVVASHYKLAARFESLKQAIENDALVLYAQEIRSLQPKDNRISFEVLVRMPALDRWVIKYAVPAACIL
ncbi:MAG TPA: GGDEF domain-containing protein [Aliidiomarina sp.]|nr:GGDEF domain-containing protein [Aliidiomarina sp.]